MYTNYEFGRQGARRYEPSKYTAEKVPGNVCAEERSFPRGGGPGRFLSKKHSKEKKRKKRYATEKQI